MPVMSLLMVSLLLLPQLLFADAAKALSADHPRMRVAVAHFGATDRFAAVYGGWDIGGGLSAQLVTELIASGRAVVVERAILSKVLLEQELGEARLMTALTKTPAGHLLGVDYLIVGEVTEFEERQMGSGAAAAFFGTKVSGQFTAAHVGMDLRVIDARTGEIISSHRAMGKAWEKAISAKIDYKLISFGGDAFHKTPLGKATRNAIQDAVGFLFTIIERQSEEFSWLGRIIDLDGEHLYINAGAAKGVSQGVRLRVSSVKRVLTDPETNQVIGLVEREIGQAEAIFVDQKYTRARMFGAIRPSVGDIVRLSGERTNDVATPREQAARYEMLE